MKRLTYCRLAGVFLAVASTCAAAQDWQPLGPRGARVSALVAASGNSSRILAATENGLFLSIGEGQRWRSTAVGLFATGGTGIRLLAASPVLPLQFFLLDSGGRLLRSEDGGESWAPTGYVHPAFDTPVAMTVTTDGLLISHYSGVLRSTDVGATFAPVADLPAGQPMGVMAINPQQPQVVLAGAFLGPFTPGDASLYRSTDGGTRWTPLAGLPPGNVTEIEYVSDGSTVVSLDGAVYRSTDAGQNWQLLFQLSGGRVVRVEAGTVQLLLTDGRNCFRSSNFFATAPTSCADGLPQWEWGSAGFSTIEYARSLNGAPRVLINARRYGVLSYNPYANSWSPNGIELFGVPTRGLAIAPTDSNWILTGHWLPHSDNEPLRMTRDGGEFWQYDLGRYARAIRSIEFDPTSLAGGPDSTRIYASGVGFSAQPVFNNSGVFKSSDGGASWQALDSGLPSSGDPPRVMIGTVRKVKLDPRSCAAPPPQGPCAAGPLDTVFALAEGGSDAAYRLIRSHEGGANWSGVGASLPDAIVGSDWSEYVLPIDIEMDRSGDAIYVSLFGVYYNDDGTPRIPSSASGVFRSSDGGSTWAASNTGLPLVGGSATTTRDVFALAVHPRKAGVLWATTAEIGQATRIYRSDDSGAHWTAAGAALDNCDVRDLQVDPAAPQVLYAAGFALNQSNGCVLRSEDGGTSWTPLHAQLPVAAVYEVRKDPQNSRRLVVASDHGIWSVEAPGDRIFDDVE
ncbi:hypothetical protein DFR29_11355 [Tahibacter aquaticus]|uniref:Sortilin (Neurotensin receptor 3) n=1 Tax=Tahibacter aquaticus TaxID=520092 RepID=A0A4R6YQW1_9GAMM|nr:sialidase family protein [Tahibacter aquaticus]TDR40355.1 hypothetical protein DFR29_11355 [Tahibacter aquaticus]